MHVKQCHCGGAFIEVPNYYQGPVHCGEAGCGMDKREMFFRGVQTLARAWQIEGISMTRRMCGRLPNPHPNYACTNPVECPNPSSGRIRRGVTNTAPFEVITRETQPTFSKEAALSGELVVVNSKARR